MPTTQEIGGARFRRHLAGGLIALVVFSAAGSVWAAIERPIFHASQKGQMFRPGELVVTRGSSVEIVNDDGDLLHHAYVDSESFSFDSGDQEPGAKVAIMFPVSGTFQVLCGIHPKMKLKVQVN